MANDQNKTMDPWVRLAAEKIREKYLSSLNNSGSSKLHYAIMDKVDDALWALDVTDGKWDGLIEVKNFRQTLQQKLTEYARKAGRADSAEEVALKDRMGLLLQRIETIPAVDGKINRERLEHAISGALKDVFADNPRIVSEIKEVSGEALGSLNVAMLVDNVVEHYKAQPAQK